MGEIRRKVYEDFKGNHDLDGFVESLEWRCSEHGGPWLAGTYYCSNGDGKVFELKTTGLNNTGKDLMERILEDYTSRSSFDDGSELTDSDLINLYHTYDVWYEEREYEEFRSGEIDTYGNEFIIHKNQPKYYLVSQLTGPIDSEPYGEPIIEKDLNKFLIDHDPCNRYSIHETTGAVLDSDEGRKETGDERGDESTSA